MPRRGDDDVIARARAGDEAAWEELYGADAQRLLVWLAHLPHLDAAADAEDVAAETWLVAARRIGVFRGDRDHFTGWLFGIARNISRSRHRTTVRRGTTPRDPLNGEEPGPAQPDPAPAVVADDATRRLLAALPEREAQVVACLDVVGLGVGGTSRALGISATAVRVAHHRGLRRLRRLLTVPAEPAPRAGDVTDRPSGGM